MPPPTAILQIQKIPELFFHGTQTIISKDWQWLIWVAQLSHPTSSPCKNGTYPQWQQQFLYHVSLGAPTPNNDECGLPLQQPLPIWLSCLKGHIDDSDFVDSDFVDSATNIINEHQLPSKDQIFQLSITVPDWMFRLYAKSSRLKSLQNQPTKIKTQTKYQEVTTIYTSDIYFSLTVPPHRSVAGVKSFLQRIFACIMTNLTVLLHCRLLQQGQYQYQHIVWPSWTALQEATTIIKSKNGKWLSPRLKNRGHRNTTERGLNPPHNSTGAIHARNTHSSVRGACPNPP